MECRRIRVAANMSGNAYIYGDQFGAEDTEEVLTLDVRYIVAHVKAGMRAGTDTVEARQNTGKSANTSADVIYGATQHINTKISWVRVRSSTF